MRLDYSRVAGDGLDGAGSEVINTADTVQYSTSELAHVLNLNELSFYVFVFRKSAKLHTIGPTALLSKSI